MSKYVEQTRATLSAPMRRLIAAEVLQMLLRYQQEAGDPRSDESVERIARAIARLEVLLWAESGGRYGYEFAHSRRVLDEQRSR